MEGAKMSKSFGNIIPLREALAKFGADPIRLSVLATAELLQDADFSPSVAKSMRDRLQRLHKFVIENAKTKRSTKEPSDLSTIDEWMLSRLQEHIRKATEAMDKLAVRKAMQSAMYMLYQDFQWYQKRTANRETQSKGTNPHVICEVLDAEIRMLAPVAPHMCEEMWETIGGTGFVSLSSWPTFDETKVNVKAEENEALIVAVLEDTMNITKATGTTPKKVHLYVAAPWKWKIYATALEKSTSTKVQQKDLMKDLMQDAEPKRQAEKVAKFVGQIVEEINHMPEERKKRLTQVGIINENQTLKDAQDFLKKELAAEVYIYNENDTQCHDPKNRAQLAKPYRPAIYIE
jgi:leucyl-tRNA synthetase